MRFVRLVPFGFLVGLLPACGDTDSDSGGTSVPIEELPAEYAKAACSAVENCFGDLLAFLRPGEDCVTNTTVQTEEELATLPAAIDAGRVKYNGAQAQKCLDELASAGCELLSQRDPESCELALAGTVEEGGDCELDAECEGDQFCDIAGSCPGACTLRKQAGATCSGNSDCVSGLICNEATGRCVKPTENGDACKGGEPDCIAGYFCKGGDDATQGQCVPYGEAFAGKVGDPCLADGGLCEFGLACEVTTLVPLTGECVKKVGSGDACRASFPSECPDDQYCTGVTLLTPEGTCTSKPEPGEACGMGPAGAVEVCAPYARCDAGTCRELAHLGESCSANATCYSEHCVDGACVASNACD